MRFLFLTYLVYVFYHLHVISDWYSNIFPQQNSAFSAACHIQNYGIGDFIFKDQFLKITLPEKWLVVLYTNGQISKSEMSMNLVLVFKLKRKCSPYNDTKTLFYPKCQLFLVLWECITYTNHFATVFYDLKIFNLHVFSLYWAIPVIFAHLTGDLEIPMILSTSSFQFQNLTFFYCGGKENLRIWKKKICTCLLEFSCCFSIKNGILFFFFFFSRKKCESGNVPLNSGMAHFNFNIIYFHVRALLHV